MATNGFGDLFGDPDDTDLLDNYNRLLGDAIALRFAFRFLPASGALDGRRAKQVADGIREYKAHIEHEWIATIKREGPRAVARYRSFTETTDEIVNGLAAIARRG